MRFWCVDCGNVWAKKAYPPGHPLGPDPEDLMRPKPRKPSKPDPELCPKCRSSHTFPTHFSDEVLEKLRTPFQELLRVVESQPEEIRQGLLYHLEREILGNLDCGHWVIVKAGQRKPQSGALCSFCGKEVDTPYVFEVGDRWLRTVNFVNLCNDCLTGRSLETSVDLLQNNENVKVGLR